MEFKKLNVMQMEELNGGTFEQAGCGNALLEYGFIPVTNIGFGLLLGVGLCVAGGFGWI